MKKIKMTIMAAMAGLLLTLSASSALAADVSIKFVLGLPLPFLTVFAAPSPVYYQPAPIVVYKQAPVVLHKPMPVVAHRPPQYGYGYVQNGYGYGQQRKPNTGYAVRR